MNQVGLKKQCPDLHRLLVRSRKNKMALHFSGYIERGLFFSAVIFLVAVLLSYLYTNNYAIYIMIIIALLPVNVSLYIASQSSDWSFAQCAVQLDNQYSLKSLFQTALDRCEQAWNKDKLVQTTNTDCLIFNDANRSAKNIRLPRLFSGINFSFYGRAGLSILVFASLFFYFSPAKKQLFDINDDKPWVDQLYRNLSEGHSEPAKSDNPQGAANDVVHNKEKLANNRLSDAKALLSDIKTMDEVDESLSDKDDGRAIETSTEKQIAKSPADLNIDSVNQQTEVGNVASLNNRTIASHVESENIENPNREQRTSDLVAVSKNSRIEKNEEDKKILVTSNTEKQARGLSQKYSMKLQSDTQGLNSSSNNEDTQSILMTSRRSPQMASYLNTYFKMLEIENE